MTNPLKKISYNSPVILTYAVICVVFLGINALTGGWFNKTFLVTYGNGSLLDPLTYVRGLLYIFGHSNFAHLFNNMLLMLLVGPVVEERYGSGDLMIMIGVTGIVGAVFNGIFSSNGLIGASGIVFMLIILCAFTNVQKGKIPLTLILVVGLYLGQEVIDNFAAHDNVSHIGHIVGGVCGLTLGLCLHRLKLKDKN